MKEKPGKYIKSVDNTWIIGSQLLEELICEIMTDHIYILHFTLP